MASEYSPAEQAKIGLVVSEPAELGSLRQHLQRVPGVDVVQDSSAPGPGELGAWDVLQVAAASGGVLAVAVKALPEFIRSRRSDITITIKRGEESVTLTATNVEEAMPVLDKWFGDA